MTEHGNQCVTDDIVAVSTIDRMTASRMKTVSSMNVCVWLCVLVVGMSLGDEPVMGESAAREPARWGLTGEPRDFLAFC